MDSANYMLQFIAQLNDTESTFHICVYGRIQRLLEIQTGRNVEQYIHILYQHISVFLRKT